MTQFQGSFFCALGLHVLPCNTPFKDVHRVSLKPKFLNDLLNEPRQTLFKTYLDYYTFDQPLSKAILARLRGYEKDRSFECARPKRKLISHSSSKVVLFNNYLDSGIFRKKFVDHTKLADRADELARAGFEIWHVGSSSDKLNDKSVYNFVSKDLRGTTSISDIVKLFSSGLIVRVVSFDNFYLHLAELYELPSDILFRGRFTSKARRVHFASVNVGLERTKIESLTYKQANPHFLRHSSIFCCSISDCLVCLKIINSLTLLFSISTCSKITFLQFGIYVCLRLFYLSL